MAESDPPMMQRWMDEAMREQPYNNIGAVLEKNSPKDGGHATGKCQTRDGNETGSEREQRRANGH